MFPAGLPVIRPESVEMSVWGVASLAGLEAGVWRGVEQLDTMRSVRRTMMDSAVLCSALSVPQPVFTITEKAPTRAFS